MLKHDTSKRPIPPDPEPISAATLVIAAISASAGVANLLRQIRQARLRSQAESRRLQLILHRARGLAWSLREDLQSFQSIWHPEFSSLRGIAYVSWSLSTTEFRQLRQIHSRLATSYAELRDTQSDLSGLQVQPALDTAHVHSLDSSVRLMRALGSVSGPEDVPPFSRD